MSLELFCRLCCTPSMNEYKCLQNEFGECNEIYEITVKYFNPKLLTEHISAEYSKQNNILCQKCWVHIENFYDFQQSVAKTRELFEQININRLSLQNKEVHPVGTVCNNSNTEIEGLFHIKVEEDADNDIHNETNTSLNHIGMNQSSMNLKVGGFIAVKLFNDCGNEKRTSLDQISVVIKEEEAYPVSKSDNYTDTEVTANEMFISEEHNQSKEDFGNETVTAFNQISIMNSPLHIKLEDDQFPSVSNVHNYTDIEVDLKGTVISRGQNNLEKDFKELYDSGENDKKLLHTLKKSLEPPNDKVRIKINDPAKEEDKSQSSKVRSCETMGSTKLDSANNEHEKSQEKGDDFVDSQKDEAIKSSGKKFKTFDKFIAEWKPQLECDACGDATSTFDLLKVHFKEKHGDKAYVKCCDHKFYVRCKLVEHIRFHRNPEMHKCDICGRLSATKDSLVRHKRTNHEELAKFQCNMCPRVFKLKHNLNCHMEIHKTGSKDFKCNHCGRAYISMYKLKAHTLAFHSEKAICDQCGKVLRSASALRYHLKQHSGTLRPPRKYPCVECGVELGNTTSLKRHKEAYHNDKSIIYVCSLCGKVSSNERALNLHKKNVHEVGRGHTCPHCDKVFKRLQNLQRHIAIHTGRDPFQCPLCPLSFRHHTKYYEHRKKSHALEWEQGRKNRSEKQIIDFERVKNQVVL